jgi:hypothetical protein
MLVRTVRKAGGPGTQKLVKKCGKRLVCIRYRYDPEKSKRYKTVKLIIAEETWLPPPDRLLDDSAAAPARSYTPRVPVKIKYHEK